MAEITWELTPLISKVTLPSGSTYYIKDKEVREWVGDGVESGAELRISDLEEAVAKLSNATHWLGITTTSLSDGSTTNPITIDGESITAVNGDIVQTSVGTEFIFNGTAWQEFGASIGSLKAFAFVDEGTVTIKPKGTNAASAVSFGAHTTDKVLGEATTFSNAASAVTFGAHTTATVLKSDVTATVPKQVASTKYLTATGSVATSGSALTSLGDPDTDTFVKSYPGATSKLATTSITGVSGSVTASKATAGTAVAVAKAGTAATVASGSLGTETATRGANTPMWGATVADETLSFTFKPISTTSVTPAVSNGNITPYTFADVTVPKAATATTVATGALSSTGSGGTVMTGLGTPTTGSGVTGYTPSSNTFAKTVSVSLSSSTSTSTGAVKYTEDIDTSDTDDVTFVTSGHTAAAITALGTGTAAAQTITVGTNDKVNAITALGAATAAAQAFTGTQENYTVTPKS